MVVSENLKRIRKEKGLTQKQLGNLCGMSEAMIRQYELGYRNPKFETLQKIANILDVPVEYLIESISGDFMTEDDVAAIEYFQHQPQDTPSKNDLESLWDSWLNLNNIHHHAPFEFKGTEGMFLRFTDNNKCYFLTKEQAERLPYLSIELIKTLIQAMGREIGKSNKKDVK